MAWNKFWLFALCVYFLSASAKVQGLPVEDTTLSTPTSVSGSGEVSGGIFRGTNLFHSFSDFSIQTGETVIFETSGYPNNIENIFARVTGNTPSSINGRIAILNTVNPANITNLYLINPNGIIFGVNAELKINGSFFASTADRILFTDGTQFSASNPSSSPLLTVSVPTAIEFGDVPGDITVRGNGTTTPPALFVEQDRTISLLGGNINIENRRFDAVNGRVELGSVGGNSHVGIDTSDLSLDYSNVENFQDISLRQSAIDVGGLGEGQIQIAGRNIAIAENSSIVNNTLGLRSGSKIAIAASETLSIREGSQISATTLSSGTGGDIKISTETLAISGTNATNDPSGLFAKTEGLGAAGNIAIASTNIAIEDNALISAITSGGDAPAGNVHITTERLLVRSGAQIQAGTFGAGDGGNLQIRSDEIEVNGTGIATSGLFTQVNPDATGNGGDLTIETQELSVRGGAVISTSTLGRGNSGDLQIDASDSIEISGTGISEQRGQTFSGIATQVFENGSGRGGNLAINTGQLSVHSGGAISAGTTGIGDGGNLAINASESVTVRGSKGNFISGISARTRTSGNAGSLSISTQNLEISDGATATVESLGTGNAGNLDISAHLIDMNRGTITGETTSGEGGNLTIYGSDIRLLNNSHISTTAGTADAPGNGGNITIVADTIVGLQNSDITANSFRGKGGRIDITAQGIIGLEFRESLTSENDITAISLFNPSLNGEVIIQTPDIDPTQGLTDIPVVENPEPIAEVCQSRSTGSRELNLGGRGTPTGSADALTNSDDGLIGAIAPVTSAGQPITEADRQPVERGDRELLLAQGWYVNSDGQLILTETPNAIASSTSAALPQGCNG